MLRLDMTPAELEAFPDFDDISSEDSSPPEWRMYSDISQENVEMIPGRWLTHAHDLLTDALGEAAMDTYPSGPSEDTLRLVSAFLIATAELHKRTTVESEKFEKELWIAKNWRRIAKRVDRQLFEPHVKITSDSRDDLGSEEAFETFFGQPM